MYKLREVSKQDICRINEWRNNKELIEFLCAPFRFINPETDSIWFENYMQNRAVTVRCVITDTQNSNIILGLVSLTDIDSMNQSAEFHILIGEEAARGKGLGYFASIEMINHAFLNLNLNRIELTVLENNERAKNLYKKIGFVYEGMRRKSVFKNGVFQNTIIMSILREEYLMQKNVVDKREE